MSLEVLSKVGISWRPPKRILKIPLLNNMLYFLTEKSQFSNIYLLKPLVYHNWCYWIIL